MCKALHARHVASMVHPGLTLEEFINTVDHIFDVVDPVARESAFLETAKHGWIRCRKVTEGRSPTTATGRSTAHCACAKLNLMSRLRNPLECKS